MPFAAKGPPAGGPIIKKGLKYIQTFFKRKPVPFAAEGPPVEEPLAEGPPSGEMF